MTYAGFIDSCERGRIAGSTFLTSWATVFYQEGGPHAVSSVMKSQSQRSCFCKCTFVITKQEFQAELIAVFLWRRFMIQHVF